VDAGCLVFATQPRQERFSDEIQQAIARARQESKRLCKGSEFRFV
jgi:hypothetical protein